MSDKDVALFRAGHLLSKYFGIPGDAKVVEVEKGTHVIKLPYIPAPRPSTMRDMLRREAGKNEQPLEYRTERVELNAVHKYGSYKIHVGYAEGANAVLFWTEEA